MSSICLQYVCNMSAICLQYVCNMCAIWYIYIYICIDLLHVLYLICIIHLLDVLYSICVIDLLHVLYAIYVWCQICACPCRVCLQSVLPGGAVCCRVVQCVAVCCSVVQCGAVCCSVLQCVVVCVLNQYSLVVQCVAVCCSVLQCVAVCCSVLQCVAVCCSVCLQSVQPICICSVISSSSNLNRWAWSLGLFYQVSLKRDPWDQKWRLRFNVTPNIIVCRFIRLVGCVIRYQIRYLCVSCDLYIYVCLLDSLDVSSDIKRITQRIWSVSQLTHKCCVWCRRTHLCYSISKKIYIYTYVYVHTRNLIHTHRCVLRYRKRYLCVSCGLYIYVCVY